MMTSLLKSLDVLVPFAKMRAQRGLFDGMQTPANMRLIAYCRHRLRIDMERVALVLFTRDIGHNSSGWWKNPDYERCWHLSISFIALKDGERLSFDKSEAEKIARAFFADDVRLTWLEPPYSPHGKISDVWHYRLFADPSWAPFKPRGEVYSRDWTPAGWRSFSDIHEPQPEETT